MSVPQVKTKEQKPLKKNPHKIYKKSKLLKKQKQNNQNPLESNRPFLRRVILSSKFKSQWLKLSDHNTLATGYKGYSSVLTNFPITEGTFYFEVKIKEPKTPLPFIQVNPSVRIGVATKQFDSELALGSDQYSYSYGSTKGNKYHQGIKYPYGEKFQMNDCIGCLIHLLPPQLKEVQQQPQNLNKASPIAIMEETNYGSKIQFFLNGKPQGLAFENIQQGFYYVGCSLYMQSRVQFVFGPDFEFPPSLADCFNLSYKPLSDLCNQERIYDGIEIF